MSNNFFVFIPIIFLSIIAKGQNSSSDNSPAVQLSNHIAQKMKDTLILSNDQKIQIYSANMQIHEWKTEVRQRYNGSDSLRYYLQRIENRRDSLYRSVLADEKYLLYLQKKSTLISNN